MTLTVEDGTGLAAAESYLSVADTDTYSAAYQPQNYALWDAALDAAKEIALRKATMYLDNENAGNWIGTISNDTQALDWPRTGAVDENDVAIDSDELPVLLTNATAELAIRAISENLTVDEDSDSSVTSESSTVAVISESKTYLGAKSEQKKFTIVNAKIKPLLANAGNIGRVSRG